ncbi:hypothetical protein ACNKHR_28320 [Shigella flexneri]
MTTFLTQSSMKTALLASMPVLGIEAVKGVKAKTMHDETAKDDTRYGTLINHNIVGTTHRHLYNFRLNLDVDGESDQPGGDETQW